MTQPPVHESTTQEPTGWPEDASRDPFIGHWHLWQRKRGHRTSTDDLITAWMAKELCGDTSPERYLDIGCGVGSVLLQSVWATRPAYSLGVEAQDQSFRMATRSVEELEESEEMPLPVVEIIHGDLRSLDVETHGRFQLVTGSPPYFPPGTGALSPDAQRRACRFELRGGIEDYCLSAARMMTDDGAFAVVFQTTWDDRVLKAIEDAGLHLVKRADFITREGRPEPFLTVYGARKTPAPVQEVKLAVRSADGEITPEYQAIRASVGW